MLWRPVASGVSQRFVLRPVQFYIILSDLEEATECAVIRLPEDTKLEGPANILESGAAMQRDPERLGEGANRDLVQFNRYKC